MNTFIRNLFVAALMSFGATAHAQPAAPSGPVILTVISDNVTQMEFDLDLIEAHEQHLVSTTTPWFDGVQEFSGPLISDLMATAGVSGGELSFVAVNDYAASMPWSDIEEFPVILASRHNGELMSLRNKGPLFVIYPFDAHPELNNEVYFSRSVWQVKAVEVRP